MKTLTINSATKKLNASKVAKSSIAFKMVKSVIEGAKTLRPCYTQGSGRFIKNQDHTFATEMLLREIGIEYVLTNDSARGGLTGNLITITTKIK